MCIIVYCCLSSFETYEYIDLLVNGNSEGNLEISYGTWTALSVSASVSITVACFSTTKREGDEKRGRFLRSLEDIKFSIFYHVVFIRTIATHDHDDSLCQSLHFCFTHETLMS